MKFKIKFKSPQAIENFLADIETSDEPDDTFDATKDVIEKFVKHGETIEIEFETDGQSARVVPVY